MTNADINEHIARKLFPNHPVTRVGSEVWCKDKLIDFRKPHLMERMLHELHSVQIDWIEPLWVVNTYSAITMSKAVALAFLDHDS